MNKLKNMKISKNFLYFMIAPLVIMLVGIILLCTVGFNQGVDFKGGSTLKVYVNNESLIKGAAIYDLDDKEDYKEVKDKIYTILSDNGLKIVSYRTSSMDISDYRVFGGQAIEIVYTNKAKGDDINAENESIRGQLIAEFGYGSQDKAVSSVSFINGHKAFNYSMEILAAIVVALALAIIYLLLRKYKGVTFFMIMQTALDLMLFLSLLTICRPVVNLTIGAAFLIAFVLSIANSFIFLNRIKSGMKTGKFEGMNNNEMADTTIKETFVKRGVAYLAITLITLLFIALAVSGVRQLAIAILLALVATFYTSNLMMPALWATVYRAKKNSSEKR